MFFLHTIASTDPAVGGPIEGIIRLAGVLTRRGHTTEIVSTDDAKSSWLPDFPLTVHALGPPLGARLGEGIRRYGYTPGLVSWLRTHATRYDVVVVHGLWQYLSFASWRALHRTTVPYVVYPHGMLDPWFKERYPLKHLKKWLYWPWADYRLIRDAKCAVFTSESERLLARKSFWLYRAREAVIRYGTADPQPLDPGARRVFLDKYPGLNGKEVILYLGRIARKKGCDLVIRAFAEAAAINSDLRLVMAGPDETYRRELERLATDLNVETKVVWPGRIAGDLKWGAFASAEAFILCSHQENFGIAVAEALGCGVPVLVSDKVNIWREIEAARAGFVAPDTLDGARKLFSEWRQLGGGDRAAMRLRARQLFISSFGAERMADSFLDIIANQALAPARVTATR